MSYETHHIEKGGPGSGHFDHEGRPGKVGGSLPSDQEGPSERTKAMKLLARDIAALSASTVGYSAGYAGGRKIDRAAAQAVGSKIIKLTPKTAKLIAAVATKIPAASKLFNLVPGPAGVVLSLVAGAVSEVAVSALIDYLLDEDIQEPEDLPDFSYDELSYDQLDHLSNAVARSAMRNIQESATSPKEALETLTHTVEDEEGPVAEVFGPMIADQIFEAMGELSDDEVGLVIPLMGLLGEANMRSLAEDGRPLPQDNEGYPQLPDEDRERLGLDDDQLRRLTPIAMLVSTLVGIYTAWPSLQAVLSAEEEDSHE